MQTKNCSNSEPAVTAEEQLLCTNAASAASMEEPVACEVFVPSVPEQDQGLPKHIFAYKMSYRLWKKVQSTGTMCATMCGATYTITCRPHAASVA